ncbi:hypothetical protein NMG60_11003818 [Bertholletia excelsa]
MKMPGLAQRNDHQFTNGTSSLYSFSCSNGSVSTNGFWSKQRDDVSYNQLQKFWNELSPQARQELLRVDKQTLFEQARKNMYCSRCNGLLLEGFLQIVMYGKSLQQEGAGGYLPCSRQGALKNQKDGDLGTTMICQDEVQDPSVHPWGGLTTTRDGLLTLLDCYLYSKSLKGLQIVFDSARARERERELLYPDACGGGGRGWISQGMAGYGRGHGSRETCALHTARLSVDTLVDFWSALGEETRLSLLRMKEEDFIERLMYRFDSKRFCRDCRRNVIREFKELKELKRMRREPRCTSWFCVADTAFQYEVSDDTIQVDWRQTFMDNVGTYHHFEWAVGTGEGKCDILEFENVGMRGSVKANGLDLGGLNACYITLRAWKMDGRCSELSAKAHALRGQQCVHCRLVVGDGFVTISRGESIRRFFEHAEEAEEEEDDDSLDKDGNELDGECSRPQKHAKSPELAREFLLDAATVIFKEQVEKAFREGTARQNAHSIFVCLALKLLEERVHVACKEIITLEKQMKLLEEEEKEKREEEERKERRRTKEREKKLRRKERLRVKEKDKEKKSPETNHSPVVADGLKELSPSVDKQQNPEGWNLTCEMVDAPSRPLSPDTHDERILNESVITNFENQSDDFDGEVFKEGNLLFANDQSKASQRKQKFWKEFQSDPTLKWSDRRRFVGVLDSRGIVGKPESRHHGDSFEVSSKGVNGLNKQPRGNSMKSNPRNGGPKFNDRFRCTRYDNRACSCTLQNDYRATVDSHACMTRVAREIKSMSKSDSVMEISKPFYHGNKYNQMECVRENGGRLKGKIVSGNNNNAFTRDSHHLKKVWEPMETQKKYPRSNSDTDVILQSSTFKVEANEPISDEVAEKLDDHGGNGLKETGRSSSGMNGNCENYHINAKTLECSKEGTTESSVSTTSNSDNCSSCLSEGDSNTCSSNSPNPESLSSSDSEDASQHSEGRESSVCVQNNFPECHKAGLERKEMTKEGSAFNRSDFSINSPTKEAQHLENGRMNVNVGGPQHQGMLPPLHNNQSLPFPMFQAPSAMGYFPQSPVIQVPFTPPNHYVYASPFGYGLNGSSPFMQYGAPQHITPPLLNPGHVPVYPPVTKSNSLKMKDETKISNSVPNGDGGPKGNSDKLQKGNSGFSLFHFGGPLDLSTKYKSNQMPSGDGIVGDLSSTLSDDRIVEEDRASNKKDTIEEYNLFAAVETISRALSRGFRGCLQLLQVITS